MLGDSAGVTKVDNEVLAARLKRLRRRAGLSQGKLAMAAGCGQTAVVAWENGESFPAFERWSAIAKALGTEPESLFVKRPRRRAA
jgi:transcriptional regulator with XRE-family HTH domain